MPAKVFEVQILDATALAAVIGIRRPNDGLDEVDCYVEGGDVRWTDWQPEHATLSASVGTLLSDGNVLEYRGDFANLRFILASGTPTLRVHKYQRSLGW